MCARHPREIYVVIQNDNITNIVFRVQSAGSVCDNKSGDTKTVEHPYGESNFVYGMSLIEAIQ